MKTKKTITAETTYRCFTENNDWEGETWNFYIPIEGNEAAIKMLEKWVKTDGEEAFQMDKTIWTASELKTLIKKRSATSYTSEHNILNGTLTLPALPENPDAFLFKFYKCQIKDYVK